jgi:ATP-dependent helicase HrpB
MYPVDIKHCSISRETAPWDAALMGVRTILKDTADGDVLVFQPGAYEIRKTIEAIKSALLKESLTVLPLYGDLPFEQQQQALSKTNCRKIIVATNIAETSLTIPGVRHVVDTGLARINRYDAGKGFNLLYTENISQASADQRSGRAGREGPGTCIRTWSLVAHNDRPRMSEAEITRVDLAEAALNLHMLGVKDTVMFDWLEKPPSVSIEAAEDLLNRLHAVNSFGIVTEKGRFISKIPAHPRLAVIMLEAASRGAADKGALAVALLSERNPFSGKPDIHDESELKESGSDFEWAERLLDRALNASFSQQICIRLGINPGAAKQVYRTQQYYKGIIDRLAIATAKESSEDYEGLAKAVVAAYPDRLARFRNNGTLQYVFAGGKSGELDPRSAARGAKYIVAGDVRETRFRRQVATKTVLSMACTVSEEWLLELFPDSWESNVRTELNNDRMIVERRSQTYCMGLLIEDIVSGEPDPAEAAQLLSSAICDRGLKLEGWCDETDRLIERVAFVAGIVTDADLPDWSLENRRGIMDMLCEGEKKYSEVKKKPVLPLLKMVLGNKLVEIEKIAPSHIALPNGRKMVLRYEAGKQPYGRARIQDLFDLKELPVIGHGKVKLTIEILAPNQRAVQVTDDLQGFWKNHYPELKKTLSRRYPRHVWR